MLVRMAIAFDAPGPALRRARHRLKGFAYSGFGRERWQLPGRVIAALPLDAGDRVADLGAGAGYFTFKLADAVGPTGRVYAVDTDPGMSALIAEIAARDGQGNVVTVAATPEDPLLPEAVDAVLLVNAFHHLPDTDRYLRTLLEYVRPGGKVAVIEALPKWFLFGHATTPDAISAAMTDAGFTRAAHHDFLARQSFQVFERPPISTHGAEQG